jgi:hypothetical protein
MAENGDAKPGMSFVELDVPALDEEKISKVTYASFLSKDPIDPDTVPTF